MCSIIDGTIPLFVLYRFLIRMKIIFAGTPDFAARALQSLIDAGHDILMVLSQPDRPSGRGMKLTASPVKSLATAHNIPVLTPTTLSLKKAPEQSQAIYDQLKSLQADVLIVAAYGLILPEAVLNCAKGIGLHHDIKAINIHGSLLPRWRGAAPVARAIEAGDTETGICLMKMELGLDTGPVIMKQNTPITEQDTSETLMQRLADIGASLLVKALETPMTLTYTKQEDEGVTYAEKLSKTESLIDWSQPAVKVAQKIRAFNPFPSTHFVYHETPIKIWEAHPTALQGKPGEILQAHHSLVIACGTDALEITIAQKPGKPRMPANALIQGLPFTVGEVLA